MTSVLRKRKGIALITVLLTMVILFILGASFIAFMGADYRFSIHQYQSNKAYFLALSGLEYARAGGVSEYLYLPPGQTRDYCRIRKNVPSNGLISCEGKITGYSVGDEIVLAARTIIAPIGDEDNWYEAGR